MKHRVKWLVRNVVRAANRSDHALLDLVQVYLIDPLQLAGVSLAWQARFFGGLWLTWMVYLDVTDKSWWGRFIFAALVLFWLHLLSPKGLRDLEARGDCLYRNPAGYLFFFSVARVCLLLAIVVLVFNILMQPLKTGADGIQLLAWFALVVMQYVTAGDPKPPRPTKRTRAVLIPAG